MLLLSLFTLVISSVAPACGAPQIALPFNAQVPSVARVSQPYSYQFAPSTFTSSIGDPLTYSIQNTPVWLQINSTARTLYGTPESSNLGPLIFNLLADDGDGQISMQATLVVVNSSTPQVGNVTKAIAQQGPLSDLTTLSLRTRSSFSVSLQGIFSDVDRPMYYATSFDHSPLPSWVQFDSASLTFSGSTPVALSAPQTYGISLHISTVEGFSEVSATFDLAVGNHQLYFMPIQSQLSVAGNATIFQASVPKDSLYLDNRTAQAQIISAITYQGPDWLSFNNSTLSISGTPPAEARSQNITFSAHDIYGDTAVRHLFLDIPEVSSSAPILTSLPTINATIGRYFTYTIPSNSIAATDYSASLSIPEGYPWLTFVSNNLTIRGNVPDRLSEGIINTTFAVTNNSTQFTESSPLFIFFHCSTGKAGSDGACDGTDAGSGSTHHLSAGGAAAIGVVVALIVLLLLLGLAYISYRKVNHDESQKRPWISRPIGAGGRWESDHPYGVGGLETGDERSIGRSVSPSRVTRHERIPSDGTYLEPADEDAIAAMNRTSLGTDALHKGRVFQTFSKKKSVPKGTWDKRTGSRKIQPKMVADALRARLGTFKMPKQLSRFSSTKSRPSRHGPAPSLRIWAAHRAQGSTDDLEQTLATPSMSSLGNTTYGELTGLETATPQTMTVFHYPKPSTTRPPPIPSRSTERAADIRVVSLAPTAATPPQLPPIQPLAPMTTEDKHPVHEKRQSYIRNRAFDKNKGSRNALFAAGGGLDENVDRGRSNRLLAVPKRSAKMSSTSRFSSLGIGRGSRLPESIASGSVSDFGKTENWITVRNDDGDVYNAPVDEERARQEKRMKWKERLKRNSKGQARSGGSVLSGGGHLPQEDEGDEEEEVGRRTRHDRTQSWIRQALSPTRLRSFSQQSPVRSARAEEEVVGEDGGRRLDDRTVSSATQASSTRAFL